jgi:hypothetical protein
MTNRMNPHLKRRISRPNAYKAIDRLMSEILPLIERAPEYETNQRSLALRKAAELKLCLAVLYASEENLKQPIPDA